MHNAVALLSSRHHQLKQSLSIAVIHGGDSEVQGSYFYRTHNPRATKSYASVAQQIADALKTSGYRNVMTLPEDGRLLEQLKNHNIDIVFCNSGGLQGYNPMSHLPAMLEMVGLPYVGHNPMIATQLDNKHIFKQALVDLDIPTPRFLVCHRCLNSFQEFRAAVQRRFGHTRGPFIVKPSSGRASIHVHYTENLHSAWEMVQETLAITANTVLLEEYLPGREFVVAVSGPVLTKNSHITVQPEPFAFSVIERKLDEGERIFTSMDKRSISSRRLQQVTDETLIHRIRTLGQQVHSGLCLQGLIRVDLRMDTHGQLSVLEANPKPDLTRPQSHNTSLVCQGLQQEQMSYEDLIESQLLNAISQRLKMLPDSIPHILQLLH